MEKEYNTKYSEKKHKRVNEIFSLQPAGPFCCRITPLLYFKENIYKFCRKQRFSPPRKMAILPASVPTILCYRNGKERRTAQQSCYRKCMFAKRKNYNSPHLSVKNTCCGSICRDRSKRGKNFTRLKTVIQKN